MVPKQYSCIFENNPHLDQVHTVNNPFIVVDKTYNLSSPCATYEVAKLYSGHLVDKSRIEIFAETCDLGVLSDYKPEIFLTEDEQEWAAQQINSRAFKIGITLRTSDGYRDWPYKHFRQLFKLLDKVYKTKSIQVLLFDHERYWDFNREYIFDAMGYPFRKMIALAYQCDLLVTLDTALLHIAGGTKIPTIALFGPIDSKCRAKHYSNVHSVYSKNLSCVPCWRNSLIPCSIAPEGSLLSRSVCMEKITPKQIFNKIMEIYNDIKTLRNARRS
jgi:ADP-heptose:LPS heptosyltransferase